tara:strand:- start:566 stop:775 length:210 start_codon:yes stop_codon:yes gene_type:complete
LRVPPVHERPEAAHVVAQSVFLSLRLNSHLFAGGAGGVGGAMGGSGGDTPQQHSILWLADLMVHEYVLV